MDTDQSLLTRYHQQGDASAFQDLVLAHGGMVFATARRITQDAALAEEVAQEVFLALARRGQDIRGSVAAWLHQVAKQKACNVIRGESRRLLIGHYLERRTQADIARSCGICARRRV